MDTFRWMKFLTHFFISLISIVFNSILIYLVYTKSPPKLGSYKHLMCYFAVLSIVYAVVDFLAQPYIHSEGSSFAMLVDLEDSLFEKWPNFAFVLICVLSGCSTATINAIAVNFLFRFFALQREGRLRYFSGKFLVAWMCLPVFIGAASGVICIWYGPNEEMSEYMSCYFLIIWLNFTISLPFFAIIFIGLKCYSKIRTLMNQGRNEYSKRLQTQLYRSLVVQALIPMIFLIFPVAINFISPFFGGICEEWMGLAITFLFSFYPAVDPIPIIYMVDDYRNAFLNFFRRFMSKNEVATVSIYDPDPEHF